MEEAACAPTTRGRTKGCGAACHADPWHSRPVKVARNIAAFSGTALHSPGNQATGQFSYPAQTPKMRYHERSRSFLRSTLDSTENARTFLQSVAYATPDQKHLMPCQTTGQRHANRMPLALAAFVSLQYPVSLMPGIALNKLERNRDRPSNGSRLDHLGSGPCVGDQLNLALSCRPISAVAAALPVNKAPWTVAG